MKKTNASSVKRNNKEGFLPSETLWRAAQMIRQSGVEAPYLNTEPAPQEMLGLAIGILRRRKNISHSQFAQKIGYSVEELLALEAGLLPMSTVLTYLPRITREIGITQSALQPILKRIKFA